MLNIAYTTHAQERMMQRAVAKYQVERALKQTKKVNSDPATGDYYIDERIEGKLLRVAFATNQEDRSVVIKTVFWKN